MADSKELTKPVKLTPLMEQYLSIKSKHEDKLLLFRMGDFYELFNEDAKTASEVLNITLTTRNKKSGDQTLMCGFPHHAMEAPINKLLDAGYSVAVCNQLEDPSEAKGIVKRGVTLMLSPGVVFNTSLLDQNESHYIFSYDKEKACWFEPSTGKAYYQKIKSEIELRNLVFKLSPKEIIFLEKEDLALSFYMGAKKNLFENDDLSKIIYKDSRKTLLAYVELMQGEGAAFGFTKWVEIKDQESLKTNAHFLKHLEVFQSNEGDKTKSLFHSLKKTKTPGGTRLLRYWLETPLVHLPKIKARHQAVYKWKEDYSSLVDFREQLSNIGDLERRIARAGHPLGSPQDMHRLQRSLESFCSAFEKIYFDKRGEVLEVKALLEKTIEEESVPQWQTKGGYIKKGFSNELDALIDLSTNAQAEVTALENLEKEKTGITSLKVRFNNVFGFYIEVTKLHKDKVPDHYVRKQTLTNAERYTTKELSALEERVLSAKSKRTLLEKEVFSEIKSQIRSKLLALKEASDICNQEDVYSSMAYLCFEKNFSIPVFGEEHKLEIKAGFHPVVADDLIKSEKQGFVTNDVVLDEDKKFFLITGPNMAGKSTMMRQVVLTAYLGQCGLVVPAEKAVLPIYESLFTRVGASDVLSEGLSTFMVEMKETAEILKNAGSKSLLILDEIGRGTSSSDGSALAESIVHYILSEIDCHSLFATHYHELTEGFSKYPGLQNIHMGYSEQDGKIIFTYKIKEGSSKKSYGIEVAKLAGLPDSVLGAATRIAHEKAEAPVYSANEQQLEFKFSPEPESPEQIHSKKVIEELSKINTLEMTPLEALTKISKWQDNFL